MATYRVTVPLSQDELEKFLMRKLWEGQRSSAMNYAKRELARMYPQDYDNLMGQKLDGYNPQIEVVKTS